MALSRFAFLLVLLVTAALAHEAEANAGELPASQHQLFRCPNRCFRRRRFVVRLCARIRRRGGLCRIETCPILTSDGRIVGYRCVVTIIFPSPSPTQPTGITGPVIVIAPTVGPTASPSRSPAASPSVTVSPSASPTTSPTPSVTATPSVTPSPTPTCSFAATGPIGGVAINGVCTCGTLSTTITVYAEADNNGGPLDVNPGTTEARECYRGCINDLIPRACDPGSFATFGTDGQAIVDSCCNRCVDTTTDPDGTGVNAATNQCRLSNA